MYFIGQSVLVAVVLAFWQILLLTEVDPVTKTNTMRKISLVSDSLFLTIQRKEVDLPNCQQ